MEKELQIIKSPLHPHSIKQITIAYLLKDINAHLRIISTNPQAPLSTITNNLLTFY